jgi:uncharacterized RDD family membrane protein YckC
MAALFGARAACGDERLRRGGGATYASREGPVMDCQFCGREISPGDQFCQHCGGRIIPAGDDRAPFDAPPSRFGGGGAWEEFGGVAPYPYAAFWKRAVAFVIDSVVAAICVLAPASALVAIALANGESGGEYTGLAILLLALVFSPLWFVYWYVATALGGGWGKRICGIRIIRISSGERPGWAFSVLRVVVQFGVWGLNVIPLFGTAAALVGYLWPLWDDNRQTWHDKAAGTIVVNV